MNQRTIQLARSNWMGILGTLGVYAVTVAVQFVDVNKIALQSASPELGRRVVANLDALATTFVVGITGLSSILLVVGHLATCDLGELRYIVPALPVAFVSSLVAGLLVPTSPGYQLTVAAGGAIFLLGPLVVVGGTTRYVWHVATTYQEPSRNRSLQPRQHRFRLVLEV